MDAPSSRRPSRWSASTRQTRQSPDRDRRSKYRRSSSPGHCPSRNRNAVNRDARIDHGILGIGELRLDEVTRAERRQVVLAADVESPTPDIPRRSTDRCSSAGGQSRQNASAGAVLIDFDFVSSARNLDRAPGLVEAKVADDVRSLHAEVLGVDIRIVAGAGGAERSRADRGDRRREAAAERRGISELQRLIEALLVRRINVVPAFAAAEEGEER